MNSDTLTVLGRGSFGCVMTPSFKCSNDINFNKHVSKVFWSKEDVVLEIKIQEFIKNILDPSSMFSIPVIDFCTITDESKVKKIKELCKREWNNYKIKKFYSITYPNLGKTTYPINDIELFTCFSLFKTLFMGVKHINNNGYIHNDIKLDNVKILFDKKISYLIDFGIVIERDNFFDIEKNYGLQSRYPYYPPESRIFYNNKKYFGDKYEYNNDASYIYLNSVIKDINRYFGFNYEIKQLKKNDIEKIRKVENTDIFLYKIDLFALGILILDIIREYIYKNKNDNKKINYIQQMIDLGLKMSDLNTFNRHTIDDAIIELDSIIINFPEDAKINLEWPYDSSFNKDYVKISKIDKNKYINEKKYQELINIINNDN